VSAKAGKAQAAAATAPAGQPPVASTDTAFDVDPDAVGPSRAAAASDSHANVAVPANANVGHRFDYMCAVYVDWMLICVYGAGA